MARLDRLGAARELAQIGAAIGREFSHELLAAVTWWPEAKLEMQLDKLIRAGLLFRQGAPPDATYLFKHALVQDAAYGLLLREPRRHLHARIAVTLESKFSEIAENKPELLARHWAEAGNIERAAALWGKAGRRSAQRSALAEATEQLRRALEMIATLSSTPALRRDEIKLHVELITPLLHVRGYAAPETRAAVERARALIERSRELGELPEDPLLLYLRSLRPVGRESCRLQWRHDARTCHPIFGARGDAERDRADHDRASPNGFVPPPHRRRRGCADASRSSDRALRFCGASRSRDPIRPGRRRRKPFLEIDGMVAAWLSRRRARGY